MGVDFEEAHLGRPVEDVGAICGSILETRPAFRAWKYGLCRRLVERYEELSRRELRDDVGASIAEFLRFKAGWREDPEEKELLREKADELQKEGLWG